MPVEPRRSAGAEQQMIDAAERIAAEQGLGAMSLRAVQAAAGQRNKSAAQYHFGTRDGLIEAVLEARMAPVNERRLQLLLALEPGADLPALVEVLVRPVAEAVLGRRDSYWARFILQGFTDPSVCRIVHTSLASRGLRSVYDRMAALSPELPSSLQALRFEQAMGLLFLTLAGLERAQKRHTSAAVDLFVADLVRVCTGVLQTPGEGLRPRPSDGLAQQLVQRA